MRPYLLIRGGVYSIHSERKVLEYGLLEDIIYPRVVGSSATNGFGAIGAGMQFSVLSGISVNFEIALHKIFGTKASLVPFLLTSSIEL